MSTVEHVADARTEPHPLLRGASAAVVRAWLLPEDRDRFLEEWRDAMDEARRTLELAGVHEVVERYRQLAVLQSDTDAFRRTVRRLAEIATGAEPPADEPLHITRENAGV